MKTWSENTWPDIRERERLRALRKTALPVRLTRRGRAVAFYLAPVVAGVIIYVAFLRDWYWT